MIEHTPFISFIVVGRNDDYGGNFLNRFQIFLNSLVVLWQRYSLDAELIIVEWNPPSDRARLRDALIWPGEIKRDLVRIIEVPGSVHVQFSGSDRMPLFEYLAKNIGIRRARGKYIVATNPDIIFSDSLIRFLSRGRLRPDCFYRVDRYDVHIPFSLNGDFNALEEFCRREWFRVHNLFGVLTPSQYRKCKLKKLFRPIIHPRGTLSDICSSILNRRQPRRRFSRLHLNASGDFFLMSAQAWNKLKAYPELITYTHLDSYLCLLAAIEFRQIILPYPIYHQEHLRPKKDGWPFVCLDGLTEKVQNALMQKVYKPDDFSPRQDNWGKSEVVFPEYSIKRNTRVNTKKNVGHRHRSR